MKKKFLCLLLCLMFVPTIFVFSACNNDVGYDLNNLGTDFCAIADQSDIIKLEKNEELKSVKLVISEYQEPEMAEVLKVAPYNLLLDYDGILNDLMGFSFAYVNICSNNTIEVSNAFKNDLKTKLNDLNFGYKNLEAEINSFTKSLNITQTSNPMLLEYLSLLFERYESLYKKAYNFNVALSRLYFNYALSNSNPDYYAKEDFGITDVQTTIRLLNARLKSQKTFVSYGYVIENLLDSSFKQQIVDSGAAVKSLPNYADYASEIAKITSVNETIDSTIFDSRESEIETFKTYAVKLYNIQACLDNDYEKFVKANVNATAYQNLCAKIIEDYNYLISQNTNALSEMLDFIGEKA